MFERTINFKHILEVSNERGKWIFAFMPPKDPALSSANVRLLSVVGCLRGHSTELAEERDWCRDYSSLCETRNAVEAKSPVLGVGWRGG